MRSPKFTHKAGMRNELKVRGLRHLFGLEGYAVWCMLQEEFAANPDGIQWDKSGELYSYDFDITLERLDAIVGYLVKVELVIREGDLLQLASAVEAARVAVRKESEKEIKQEKESTPLTPLKEKEINKEKEKEKKSDDDVDDDDTVRGAQISTTATTALKVVSFEKERENDAAGFYDKFIAMLYHQTENGSMWSERMCMDLQLTKQVLLDLIKEFDGNCVRRGKTHENEQDTKSHFESWYRLKQELKAKEDEKQRIKQTSAMERSRRGNYETSVKSPKEYSTKW